MKLHRRSDIQKSYVFAHTAEGGGSTYLSVIAANYLHSVMGYEVIYIEVATISQLLELVIGKGEMIGEKVAYRYKGVKYILSCNAKEARELVLALNCHVVVNIRDITEDTQELVGICDRLFLTGNMSPWNKDFYMDFVSEKINKIYDANKITFISNARKKEKRIFESMYGYTMYKKPVVEDPFKLKQSEIPLLRELLL